MLVCALIGMGPWTWVSTSEGQVTRQQETRADNEQAAQKQGDRPALSPRTHSGQPVQSAVTVENGKLSVSLREARFRDVMEAIARQGGIRIRFIGQGGQATLTDSFAGLPLEGGLRRLLRGMNYVFVYWGTEPEPRVAQVFVMSGRGAQSGYSGETTVPPSETISDAFNTQRFAEALETAIAAEGRTLQEDRTFHETIASELNAGSQHVLSGQVGHNRLSDRFQQLADQLQLMLERRVQHRKENQTATKAEKLKTESLLSK